jgi:hypothetical protein
VYIKHGKVGRPAKDLPEPYQNPDGTYSIPLAGNSGGVAIVDAEDLPVVRGMRWYLHRNNYAYSATGKKLMHRVILPGFGEIDHVNGNGLDNRRNNLRSCSHSENMHNSRKLCLGSSQYRGVRRLGNSWIAEIRNEGKRTYLGSFREEIAAARAYDSAARTIHGAFASLNL